MRFGPVAIADAEGAVAAHSVRAGDVVVKKGSRLSRNDVEALAAAGIGEIVAARLEDGDVDENEAADVVARAVAGRAVVTEAPFTGRANLFAAAAGVLVVDTATIDALNAADEALTLATLPAFKPVVAGEMVATVKIIPYGVAGETVERALAEIGKERPVSVAAYRLRSIAVISTELPGLKASVIDKTLKVMAARLDGTGAGIVLDRRVPHAVDNLAHGLADAAGGEAELVIVFGASAITDRRDVIPAALLAAGGTVEHLGMPVDPGNLLMIGSLRGKPVLGAPGCARSSKENGFDWVLQRLLCGVAVGRAEVQRMGVGGLLMEIVSRPQPRAPGRAEGRKVGGIVLAAGRSSRMGDRHKLLAEVRSKPLLRHAVEAQIASRAEPVIVVAGHRAAEVRAVLDGLEVVIVENPAFAEGLSTSLRAGLAALPEEVDAGIVSLGDMPNVTPEVIDRLIDAFADAPEAKAVVPTLLGQRGNPVLLSRALFAQIGGLSGDQGARRLLEDAGEAVIEIALDDPAIALDVDTPEALAALQAG